MAAIKYTLKDLMVKTRLQRAKERIERPQQALSGCGLVLQRSIAKNFKAGGRPVRWQPSLRARKSKGQTLVKTARLKNSISMQVIGRTLRVGTNVVYAAIHHLGGSIRKNATVKSHLRIMTKAFGKLIAARRVTVRSHSRQMNLTLPARPYLLVQDEDLRVMKRILAEHVTQ